MTSTLDGFRAAHQRNLDLLGERLRNVSAGGGAKARERHVARGKLLPRDRVDGLLDVGSPFIEVAPLAAFGMYGDKVPAEVRSEIETSVTALKEMLKGEDGEAIKRGIENVQKASYKLGEHMYKNAAPDAGAGVAPEAQSDRGTTGDAKKDDDVIDAEVVDNK